MLSVITNLITCKLCKEIFDRPVILPCGDTICSKHEELYKQADTSKCELCARVHKLNESEHFPANKVAQSLIANEINKLDFGEDHKKARELINELNELKSNYDNTKNSVEDLIFEKFHEMRRKVDLIREEIIQKVNDCSDKILSDIKTYEKECKANLSELDKKLAANEALDLTKIKNDLNEWDKKIRKLFYDEELCKEVQNKNSEYSEKLKNGIKQLKNEIFLGEKKKFDFETKYANIFDVFCKNVGFNA
jgi:hypothetical protein